jgi:hypothetical protein
METMIGIPPLEPECPGNTHTPNNSITFLNWRALKYQIISATAKARTGCTWITADRRCRCGVHQPAMSKTVRRFNHVFYFRAVPPPWSREDRSVLWDFLIAVGSLESRRFEFCSLASGDALGSCYCCAAGLMCTWHILAQLGWENKITGTGIRGSSVGVGIWRGRGRCLPNEFSQSLRANLFHVCPFGIPKFGVCRSYNIHNVQENPFLFGCIYTCSCFLCFLCHLL